MSEKHLAERLMYPLPDGWQDDSEQVAALKEIWPKIIAKNKELIDAEIASLRAQLDEARTLLADVKDHFIPFLNWAAINEIDYDVVTTCDRISALLSESKS